jgi:heme/copper-type cytochrome/quinol oxidase subunit 2
LTLSLVLAPGFAVTGAQADELTFELHIARGQLPANMRVIRVKQGDIVKLRWSSDRSIALHLHGYDIERKVEPGAVAEMTFTARATGRFSVQEHQSRSGGDHTHGAFIVQVEVLPR